MYGYFFIYRQTFHNLLLMETPVIQIEYPGCMSFAPLSDAVCQLPKPVVNIRRE